MRFEQFAPEDPNVDFTDQTAFVATLDRRAEQEGAGQREALPRRRAAPAAGRSRCTGALFVDVSFGDFPYAIRFTPVR